MRVLFLVLSLSVFFASSMHAVDMLSCCPGENTATEARFVWHHSDESCVLYLAEVGDSSKRMMLPGSKVYKPVTFRSGDVNYWKYTAQAAALRPGTEYEYWVESAAGSSPRQKFRTAGTDGNYNFLWMGDVHSYPSESAKMTTVELLRQDAEAKTASSGGIDFVLFSGDAVKFGSRYDNWQQWNFSPAVTNYMFAMVPGNKEYYYTGKSTFNHYNWYLAVKNNPPNGPAEKELEGCYWFLRDSVMFVGIDSLVYKGKEMSRYGDTLNVLRDQTNWFDRVVSSQKGKFRYLVVFQHDPWFVYVAEDDSFDKSRGYYNVWRHVFDKHKVDLALSGDQHNYIRSKPLRGDSAAAGDGTIYMVSGQIEGTNYSATVTADLSGIGNAEAKKYLDCAGVTDASCGACWIEVRPEALKLTSFWDKFQSPNFKIYDTVRITPKDRGFAYKPDDSLSSGGVQWVQESATNVWRTGAWSSGITYDVDGRAHLDGEVSFTPYAASTGNVVTVETKVQFYEYTKAGIPDADAQAAVRISTNGCFQVWSRGGAANAGNIPAWADVEAEGLKPVSGAEYTLRITFDYAQSVYSVEVKTDSTEFAKLSAEGDSGKTKFPLASSAKCVSNFTFVGETFFTSLSGDCRMVVIGFAENETVMLKDNGMAILDAAKAAWLNKCAGGDKAAAGSAAANLTEKEFKEAYLLNLDIADGTRSYSLEITDVEIGEESVAVAVSLKRAGVAGGEAEPINGTLKFYGASTLEAFKNAGLAPIVATDMTDGDFSKSDTATATFPKGDNKFFRAKIVE